MDTVSTTTVLVRIELSKIVYGTMVEGSVHTVQCMIWPHRRRSRFGYHCCYLYSHTYIVKIKNCVVYYIGKGSVCVWVASSRTYIHTYTVMHSHVSKYVLTLPMAYIHTYIHTYIHILFIVVCI